MADETTPLLSEGSVTSDPHAQFCVLIGIPSTGKHDAKASDRTLYSRATRKRKSQTWTYNFTAALSNTLLLSQVVLGATLTALGASSSSHVLITIFGVLNTIIAGLVAYLKSRGQPMRARMFRDDLEHVVDEIENSKTMWLGIHNSVHGYDEIDIDDKVSVRSEVARLTRLYESAVKKYMSNNPDMYTAGGGLLDAITGLRARPGAGVQIPPAGAATDAPTAAAGAGLPQVSLAAAAPVEEADDSPATAKDTSKADDAPATTKDDPKADGKDKGADFEAEGKDKTDKPNENDKGKDEETDGKAEADAKEDTAKNNGGDATAGASSKDKADDPDEAPATAKDPPKKDD